MSRSAIGRTRLHIPQPAPGFTVRRSSTVPKVAGSSRLTSHESEYPIPPTATASTILAITREVGEMLRGVPYVKAISGIILEIIRIKEVRSSTCTASWTLAGALTRRRQEVTDNKWRCQELIDKVVRRSETIFCGLKKVLESPGREGLKDLEKDLIAYTA